jgi:homoserine kinase
MDPDRYQRVPITVQISIALVLPSISILTEQARNGLPENVPFLSAVKNASGAAGIVAACINGDLRALGRCIMVDEIVEPVRAALVTGFEDARKAALKTGAFGVALSGSGPAMFAICAHDGHARRVAGAMSTAFSDRGVDAASFVAHPSNDGCILEDG